MHTNSGGKRGDSLKSKDPDVSFDAESMRPLQIIDLKRTEQKGEEPAYTKFLVMFASMSRPNAKRRKIWMRNLDKLGDRKIELLGKFRTNILDLAIAHQMREFSELRLRVLDDYLRAHNIDAGPRSAGVSAKPPIKSSSKKVLPEPNEDEPKIEANFEFQKNQSSTLRPKEPEPKPRGLRTPQRAPRLLAGRDRQRYGQAQPEEPKDKALDEQIDYLLNIQLSERILDIKKKFIKENLIKGRVVCAELEALHDEIKAYVKHIEDQVVGK